MDYMKTIDTYIPDFTSILLKNNQNKKTNESNSNEYKNPYFLSLIEESVLISSNQFLTLLLGFYLKNNKNVILVSERENLNHYATLLRKLVN
ncbi:MAG: hypothetical protein MJ252_01235 [archaeon]|nr:hypothetical protein [archaeon]